MLKIRKEQFEAFEAKTDDEIVDFIVKHLREEGPDLVGNLPSLPEMVRNGMARARSHGLRSLEDLTAFVSIMFEVAPNFDEHPKLRRVLDNERVPVEERLDGLFESELDKAWDEAARYDGAAWAEAWFPELKQAEG
jgi:hypothetical protein